MDTLIYLIARINPGINRLHCLIYTCCSQEIVPNQSNEDPMTFCNKQRDAIRSRQTFCMSDKKKPSWRSPRELLMNKQFWLAKCECWAAFDQRKTSDSDTTKNYTNLFDEACPLSMLSKIVCASARPSNCRSWIMEGAGIYTSFDDASVRLLCGDWKPGWL